MQNFIRNILCAISLIFAAPCARATCPSLTTLLGSQPSPRSEQIQQAIRGVPDLPLIQRVLLLVTWQTPYLKTPGYLPGLDSAHAGHTATQLMVDQLGKVLGALASTITEHMRPLAPETSLQLDLIALLKVYAILHDWYTESVNPLPSLLTRYQRYRLIHTGSAIPPTLMTQIHEIFTRVLLMSEPDQLRLIAKWEKEVSESPTHPYLPGLNLANKGVRYLDLSPSQRGNVSGNYVMGCSYVIDAHATDFPNTPFPERIIHMLELEAVLAVFHRKDPVSREGYALSGDQVP